VGAFIGARASLLLISVYALYRVVMLSWARVFPFSISKKVVSFSTDALPLLLALPAVLRVWFEPPVLSHVGQVFGSTSTAQRTAAVCDILTRFVAH